MHTKDARVNVEVGRVLTGLHDSLLMRMAAVNQADFFHLKSYGDTSPLYQAFRTQSDTALGELQWCSELIIGALDALRPPDTEITVQLPGQMSLSMALEHLVGCVCQYDTEGHPTCSADECSHCPEHAGPGHGVQLTDDLYDGGAE